MTQNDQALEADAPVASHAVRVIGQVTLLAIFVQFILAGLGTFDTAHGGTFKDSNFTLHDRFALVIVALTVLMLIVALVTRSGRMVVGESLLLALLVGPVQHALATTGTDHAPWVGSLHVLTGVLILILDAHVAFPGRRRRPQASKSGAI
ncbi:DUF6220 domain-containing protein [Actinoallomurus sp. CA-150999]|uniref:DUF6220 domain-containing protein n=1 Tax=Actinoallomurus sp. CA-150999 TaxID=3239887 RepID=UPI003D8D3E43